MPDSWRCVVAILLTALSAIFTYCEIYLDSLAGIRLDEAAQSGDVRAKRLSKMKDKERLYLSSLRAGAVVCSLSALALLLIAYLEKLADALGGSLFLSALIIVGAFAVVSLLLTRFFPERLAAYHARHTENFRAGGIVCALGYVFVPLAALLCAIGDLLVRLCGIDPDEDEDAVTEEEILDLVDSGEEDGNIESDEKEMIENIFDFSDITAGDVMTHRTAMSAIDVSASEEEILALIDETGYSRYPVYEDDQDNIIGILSVRAYLLNRASGEPKSLRDILWAPYLIPEAVHADTLLRDMKKRKTHMAVVLDEYGGTAGIVTMEDLLEEIVGSIFDETDDPSDEQDIIKLEENRYRVSGACPLEKLSEELSVTFEEDIGCDTLGGLVFSCLTVIPDDGEHPTVEVCGLRIEVEKLAERRVEWAVVEIIE